MRKCYDCKFCDIDYEFDEEEGEEYEIWTCDKGNDTDSEEECADYKKYKARKPKETSYEPNMPKIDKDGYTQFQLHRFMNLYGKHMRMCDKNVIEPLDIILCD